MDLINNNIIRYVQEECANRVYICIAAIRRFKVLGRNDQYMHR